MRTEVTPEKAAAWLEKNIHNRPIRRLQVEKYVRDIKNGDWLYTGESIKFAPDGTLLDGQQRLTAVVEAGIPIVVEVQRNIDPAAQQVMDTGAARSAGDVLHLRGIKYGNLVASAAKLALGVEAGLDRPGYYSASHSEITGWVDDNPGIHGSVELAGAYAKKIDCPPTIIAYTHYTLAQLDVEEATDFWIDMAEKAELSKGDPVLALIQRLADMRRLRQRVPKHAYLSLIYRTWNARREGRTLQLIRVVNNGEVIPVPVPK